MREAEGAFGDPTAFIEQAVGRPRHIEVQILADEQGSTLHLFERDCSVQRRHQKVVEIAPAPNISDELRQALCGDAVRFAESINYSCAGTVEFLVETEGPRAGQHVFIEMNPRIQVEHTITEEITDVDLVQAQMRIASGETLDDLGLSQEEIRISGAALQCRITTEDPANGFRPDTGTITAYRSAGGAGVRLDGGTVDTGVEISAHFDSMLVRSSAGAFEAAVSRARRALRSSGSGVSTNIPFSRRSWRTQHLLPGTCRHPSSRRPELLTTHVPADRGTPVALVGRGDGQQAVTRRPGWIPRWPRRCGPDRPSPHGLQQRLLDLGPVQFSADLRARTNVEVTDTTFRDAHQSLLATQVRTKDLIRIAPYVGRTTPELFSVECWGGATYDVALRFLSEIPGSGWRHCATTRPVCACRCCSRPQHVGYTPYPPR